MVQQFYRPHQLSLRLGSGNSGVTRDRRTQERGSQCPAPDRPAGLGMHSSVVRLLLSAALFGQIVYELLCELDRVRCVWRVAIGVDLLGPIGGNGAPRP